MSSTISANPNYKVYMSDAKLNVQEQPGSGVTGYDSGSVNTVPAPGYGYPLGSSGNAAHKLCDGTIQQAPKLTCSVDTTATPNAWLPTWSASTAIPSVPSTATKEAGLSSDPRTE